MTLKIVLLSEVGSLVLGYLGSAANRFVIKANGGHMPSLDRPVAKWIPLTHALRKGAIEREEKGVYVAIGPDTKFLWMADIIYIGIGCASFGDMLIFAAYGGIIVSIACNLAMLVSHLAAMGSGK